MICELGSLLQKTLTTCVIRPSTPAELSLYQREFKQILALVPNFSETLNTFADDIAALMNFVNVVCDSLKT
jgi:hypothetical protein